MQTTGTTRMSRKRRAIAVVLVACAAVTVSMVAWGDGSPPAELWCREFGFTIPFGSSCPPFDLHASVEPGGCDMEGFTCDSYGICRCEPGMLWTLLTRLTGKVQRSRKWLYDPGEETVTVNGDTWRKWSLQTEKP